MNWLLTAFFTLLCLLEANGGIVAPEKSKYVVFEGRKATLIWTSIPGEGESATSYKIYNGTVNVKNLLWDKILGNPYTQKSKDMFGKRFEVNVDDQTNKITTTILNVNLNDSATLVLQVIFLKDTSVTSDIKPIELEVSGGPDACGSEVPRNKTFNFSTQPSIDICIAGNPQPNVEFTFDGNKQQTEQPLLLDSSFHQYQYKLKLPQLEASHCGKVLSYTATSALQGSQTINGEITITVLGFPLDVTGVSFLYNNDAIPTVRWNALESGNCEIQYFLTIRNQTGVIERNIIQKGPAKQNTIAVPEMSEPTNVEIYVMYGTTKGSTQSAPFTKTTTTTTTTVVPSKSTQNNDSDGGSNLGVIIGAVIGGIVLIAVVVIIVICVLKKKNHGTQGSQMSLEAFKNGNTQNHYTRVDDDPLKKEDPNQAIYSELGPGGRVGPKPEPNFSNYAEVKVDKYGYPITGESQGSPNNTLYDQVRRDSDDDYDTGVIV